MSAIMSKQPYTVRWGILATGSIAEVFAKDLLVDPATRGVCDVAHTVVAAASSASRDRAQRFLRECRCPSAAVAYGSYEELVTDKNVDVVYIATPHSHHYQNALLALEAGKNVLCEKAFTVNAAQARRLVATARAKGLFLMEAVWTRYFPLSVQIRRMIEDQELGAVYRVIADLSLANDVEERFGTEHRMVNLNLAGGALLDLGIYSLTWVFQTLYHTLPVASRRPPTVTSMMTKYALTGADEQTSILLSFPAAPGGSHAAHGIALTAMRIGTDVDGTNSSRPAIRIQGTEGEIQVDGPAYRPTAYRVISAGDGKDGKSMVREVRCEIPGGHGMFWEADEVARCLRDGRLESEGLGWEESCVIMEVMDEVRRQGGLVYPARIESTDFPLPI